MLPHSPLVLSSCAGCVAEGGGGGSVPSAPSGQRKRKKAKENGATQTVQATPKVLAVGVVTPFSPSPELPRSPFFLFCGTTDTTPPQGCGGYFANDKTMPVYWLCIDPCTTGRGSRVPIFLTCPESICKKPFRASQKVKSKKAGGVGRGVQGKAYKEQGAEVPAPVRLLLGKKKTLEEEKIIL